MITFSSLDLGYRIRRAKLDECEGLSVYSHDLDSFCIPIERADGLATAYKRYLVATGILDWAEDRHCDEQQFEADRYLLGFFHERDNTPFVLDEFSLAAAIEFVWLEAEVPIELGIRWCMMMEFIIWQDQRQSEKSSHSNSDINKTNRENPATEINVPDHISAA